MAKTKTAGQKSGLTMKHLIGYGAGDFGGCMTFALMGSIATRYYTNVLQVNTVILAAILLVWNVWDAVNDPLVGALMDKIYAKSHNPKGKFRPWLLRSAPLVCVTAIVFWTVPTFFEGTTMLVVLFFTKILYEGCYTFFNIPMGSLLSSMAENDKERSSLSSARGFGSLLGNMVPLVIFPQLLAMLGDTPKAFAIGSGIAGVSILMQWGLVGEAIDYNEMVTGKRTEGSIYGTFNLARRIGQSFGNSAAVLALGWIGYDATLAVQSAFTIGGIKALVVLIPGLFVLGSWAAFKYVWNINADIRAKMAEFKNARKAG